MHDLLVSAYILVWPAVVAVVLALIVRGVWRDSRRARRRGEDMV
ncbi:putative transporter small subunit [Stenotrophomonas mori]|uniref:Transporter small subunit n=1 Tax=Stenotrophomonas mori TaxID=2871096 RepID=A0ABT0SGW8_9GAMM|nr:putative transporter small subunit [Stenotrophomonas mori]MCL7714558.1 putative transporter small subunit [Stenotrophomonas mori]